MKQENLVGTIIGGRFEVAEFIGEGGMGIVFRGIHHPMGTSVAIKVLKSEHAKNEKMLARFRREVRSNSHIQHRNVVGIIDSGQLEDGRLYLVMEFIRGPTLVDILDEIETMPTDRALRFMIQIADGLAAAHSIGIMHRDLKPENIISINTPDGEIVKILDFGLAKMVESGNPQDKITMTGEVFGTPVYMSPEQCLGGELDLTTDVYSFGIMAYEMLTGEPPFDSPNIVAIMLSHKNEQPKSLREIWPEGDIPREVDDFVLKCLEKNGADRFANGMELSVELRKIQDHITRIKYGAPADLRFERRLPTSEYMSIDSGTSLTPGEIQMLIQKRLREKIKSASEILRQYNYLSPSHSVGIARICSHEDEISQIRSDEESLVDELTEKESALQKRVAQLRIAVQDLSYDRETLGKKIKENPGISTRELCLVFPYLDAENAPPDGKSLLDDISFQITALEKSIADSSDSFQTKKGIILANLKAIRILMEEKEKYLQKLTWFIADDFLVMRQTGDLHQIVQKELQTLEIYYNEARKFN
ncbi:MAG: serine/threonine protein kinase [Deltaproteobacteria bacterium]|nr:serine/threonine protein kinase [Deltaproteobacteria bacterium]